MVILSVHAQENYLEEATCVHLHIQSHRIIKVGKELHDHQVQVSTQHHHDVHG